MIGFPQICAQAQVGTCDVIDDEDDDDEDHDEEGSNEDVDFKVGVLIRG